MVAVDHVLAEFGVAADHVLAEFDVALLHVVVAHHLTHHQVYYILCPTSHMWLRYKSSFFSLHPAMLPRSSIMFSITDGVLLYLSQ